MVTPLSSRSDHLKHKERRNIRVLAWVSLLNDLGSETLLRMLPLFVTGILGAPMTAMGAIEGLAEAASVLLKPVFGALSDRLGKRKAFVVGGYLLSALSRPLLAVAGSWGTVAGFRLLDRFGKGVRTAPRDALIADSSPAGKRGFSFGLNRALDTVGALLGVAAFAAWNSRSGSSTLTAKTWIGLVLVCSVPGFFAVALTGLGVQDRRPARAPEKPAQAPRLDPLLKRYLAVVAVFGLANSSDAFILLRARELGYSLTEILGIVLLLNGVSAITALPAAMLSDRYSRRTLIAAGWLIYAAAYGLMGSGLGVHAGWFFASVVGAYGLFYGFTDGVERAWVADLAPPDAKGRAYGFFGLVAGLSALPASVVFGWIWDHFGSPAAFLADSAVSFLAAGLLLVLCRANVPVRAPESLPG